MVKGIDKTFLTGIFIGLFLYSFHKTLTEIINYLLIKVGVVNTIAQGLVSMVLLGIILLWIFGFGINKLIKIIRNKGI